jgi:hypothetical protein
MAITRSQIARQLLAEGGAPRKGFANGYSVQDDMTDYGANVGREASPGGGFEGGDSDPTTGSTFPNLNKVTPKDVFKTSADNPMLQRSAFERMMLQMIPGIGGAINLGEMNAFNFPQFRYSNTGGGNKFRDDDEYTGDNNIVKPMMPMIPKLPTDIEPEKSDYAEFVQRFTLPERFRLSAGGSPGNTTSQRVLPRADGRRPGYYGSDAGFGDDDYKDESASFDAGSGSGGSDADFAAARDAIYGTTRSGGGGTTNVTGFGPMGRPAPVVSYAQKAKDLAELDAFLNSLNKEEEQKGKGKDIGLDFAFTPDAPKAIKEFTGTAPLNQLGGLTRQQYQQQLLNNMADGGEVRQAYGLGKLVKKVTGAVKKVAKSPIGKAAIVGATAFGIPGTQMGGLFGRASFGGSAPGMFGLGGIGNFFASGPSFKDFATDTVISGKSPFSKLLGKIPGGGATAAILGTSIAAGVLTPKEEEEVDSLSSRIADNTGIDVEQIRKEVQEAYASGNTEKLRTKYPFLITESAAKAEGGRIGFENGGTYEDFEKFMMKRQESMSERQKEELRKQFENYMRSQDPTVEAAEGGSIVPEEDEMLNMGGNEMDLRGGGFVPLGEYEKKDDVPARLSKNEFVFTADAVRAAGGGSVDRGADLMYKTMKQLENKVV